MNSDRPNFVLFMPETLRADAVFGPRRHRACTPNLDRLKDEGAAFTNCFAQMAFCSPSRCGMFTGLYPHTRGHRSLLALLKPDETNLFGELKAAGYRNLVFGKNDLLAQESIPRCFDEWEPRFEGEKPSDYQAPPPPEGSRWQQTFYRGRREHEDCRDRDWRYVQSALQFLDESHKSPFCLYLPFSFAHPPYQVEEPYFSMHRLEDIPRPIPAEVTGKRGYLKALRRAYGMDALSQDDLCEIKRVYFGMVSRVDHQLGLLVDKLKARGLYDNTVIAVFSDHGDYAGDFGMVEKFVTGFEDCLLHVPLVLRGPGIRGDAEHGGLCEMTDLFPTLLELAGLDVSPHQFGASLGPRLRGEIGAGRDAVFAEGGHLPHEVERFHVQLPGQSPYRPMYDLFSAQPSLAGRAMMVRTERWKYVYAPYDRDELYDLADDLRELDNLATDSAYEPVVCRLRERLLRWLLDTADVLPAERDPRKWMSE